MSVIVTTKMILNATQAREETLDGRTHLVVPIVIFTEGVHVANAGPLFYGSDKIGKDYESWNQMPLVVYHPEVNGQFVSARNPKVADARRVGYVYNASFNKPKLGGEAWIDVEKSDKVDPRIVADIRAGKTVEISAGIVTDIEEKVGVYNEVEYKGEVFNIRPDHVALLPDKKGACDVSKGCGCGVNVVNQLMPLVANEASFDRIRENVSTAVYKLTDYNAWVRDVYSDFFIYRANDKLWKRGYKADKEGNVTLAEGDPTEVKWVMEYRDTKGNFVGNTEKPPEEPTVAHDANKTKDILTANVGYTEAELTVMDAPTFEATHKTVTKVVANRQQTPPAPLPVPASAPAPAPAPAPSTTFSEWLVANNAPAGAVQFVTDMEIYHGEMVANILANPANKLSEQVLRRMGPRDLQAIQTMLTPAGQTQPTQNGQPVLMMSPMGGNYVGQGSVPVGNQGQKPQPLGVTDPFGPKKPAN